ncbi:MBL fold metallo-hydrolase [Caldimonas brevitalea]|uniref:Metallo-beta-lactamase domain-containing protein n=1 Tax=Caldimonas brevitalea TaxID=413882 RepID=A0A0G3BKY4_9BURK|nr:MBL fold metallo-hydrolase [Caldimonas brevitalea]AKJ30114.1 hypothetical protein AAW51_3423 [Caldimonas brevitalea]
MFQQLAAIVLVVTALVAHAQPPTPAPAAPGTLPPTLSEVANDVRFAIVKTSQLQTRERMLFSGGRFSEKVDIVFSAVLVQHGQTSLLFDTGLGSQVAEQYAADMPWWNRPFFRYDNPVTPVRRQLEQAGIPPVQRIVVSHAHWDHLSGLADFPEAEVWLSSEEHHFLGEAGSSAGSPWPSQVAHGVRWKDIEFQHGPHEGFERSQDLFGDGRVVLVPLYGHTPGSVGLFVTVTSGTRYFFVGDVVWNVRALQEGRPKNWAARRIVDHDVALTQAAIEKIRAVMQRDPKLVVVPAHDGPVQSGLGYFPHWVR